MSCLKQRVLLFKKLSDQATIPSRGSNFSVGYDLHSAEQKEIPPRGKAMISTGLQMKLPEGCYGRVAPRSGLAWKHSIDVGAGVIDPDYRGELRVILFNLGDETFQVNKGDRIAQLICEQALIPEVQEVTESLDETERGSNGFGSTGV